MGNFDTKTTKIMIALITVFAMIIVCLPYSYRNMKKNPQNELNTSNKYSVPAKNNEFDTNNIGNLSNNYDKINNEQIELIKDRKIESKNVKISQPREDFSPKNKLEIIDEVEPLVEIHDDEFSKANSLRTEKKYESAVYEYEQIAKLSDDKIVKAKCYEEIAITYAIMKRYGSALPYAEKAYSTESTNDRKILLAKLLYKTGHEDKAKEIIDELLKSDF